MHCMLKLSFFASATNVLNSVKYLFEFYDDFILNLAPGVRLGHWEVVRDAGWGRPVNVASRHQANLGQSDDKDAEDGDDEEVEDDEDCVQLKVARRDSEDPIISPR